MIKTKKERAERFNAISELGCIVCVSPPQIHHCIGHEFGTGKGLKAKDDFTIGLCHHHHVGAEGIHVIGRKTWEKKYGRQSDLLELTNARLYGDISA